MFTIIYPDGSKRSTFVAETALMHQSAAIRMAGPGWIFHETITEEPGLVGKVTTWLIGRGAK